MIAEVDDRRKRRTDVVGSEVGLRARELLPQRGDRDL
jgi:hypothetical protein